MSRDPLSTEQMIHGMAWDREPQQAKWLDEDTRYWLMIVRHPSLKHLCGYIGIPQGHPWWKRGYDDVRMADNEYPDVHGGFTYADDRQPGEKEHTDLWWLGFDCAHSGDLTPGLLKYREPMYEVEGETYRDWDYVRAELQSIAKQAKQTAKSIENAP